MNNQEYYNSLMEDELNINLKKIFFTFWSRKWLMLKVGIAVFLLIVLSTFFSAKKWKVDADLYINKSNNTNMMEVNPYVIDEMGTLTINSVSDKVMMNELELMQSPLVIDKVIQENDLRFKKLFGIIPTVKTGEYLTTEKFLKKKIKFENKKGTNIISISYKCKDKDEAYNVVSSIINNYILLHKELNSEKSKSDKKIIESEYQKAKADLNKKVNVASGLPTTSMSGSANLAAMSAFSRSAQNAMATLRGQYLEGEKARVEINEDASKVSQLASKLEWARLVEEMSDSSKVLVIKEPKPLRDWEYTSPKLFKNIILGIVFGAIFSLFALIYSEKTDKMLTYSMLGDNVIYNLEKDLIQFSAYLFANKNKKFVGIYFDDIPQNLLVKLKTFKNLIMIKANISEEISDLIHNSDSIITFIKIGKTPTDNYFIIKNMVTEINKKIAKDVIIV